eukprot:TRINITY_DN6658_c0_g1_i1.p1 TRINITY_DN6658_c0_g1~~TRINITY_DN6658_c0_g1_i1.p1  ORF type:complete len:328 (+),score=133.34 TRINITY_DN6658_c0_g1_i1:51-986(+)
MNRTVIALAMLGVVSGFRLTELEGELKKNSEAGRLPTVTAHGMGDSCFNRGFKQLTEAVANTTGSYAVCIPGAPNEPEDTLSGFFVNMNENVKIFAKKVKEDPKLAGGFNAIGLSQGNSVIRGYIQKYNDPPVKTWLSVHGTVMGVAGFPNCNPAGLLAPVCDQLDEKLGDEAYYIETQEALFQANYFRDPMRVNTSQYKRNSQLGEWNGEGERVNPLYKENFVKVERFAMIKAMKDTMVYPNWGEWWGQFTPGSYHTIQKINETDMYQRDTFGLKTVHEAGKILFNHTDGNHLVFSMEQLEWWVNNYFLG